jgi:hypothetical protein
MNTDLGNSSAFSFAIKSEGFIMTKTKIIKGSICYVIHIPEWVFLEGGKTFGHYNSDKPRARIYYAFLQLWVFVIHVLTIRIGKNIYKSADFPIEVYLETLRDCKNNLTNNHRLWIFENRTAGSSPLHSISEVFRQAILSDKRFDATGAFLDYSPVETLKNVNVAKGAIVNNADASAGNNASVDPAAQGRKNPSGSQRYSPYSLMQHELYKLLNGPDIYARCADIYTGKVFYSRSNSSLYDSEITTPKSIFNIETAFNVCDLNICPGQRDINNYRSIIDNNGSDGDGINYAYTLSFFKDTFCVPLYEFNPHTFFFKTFPYTQIDETQMKWNAFIEKLAIDSYNKEMLRFAKYSGSLLTPDEYAKRAHSQRRDTSNNVDDELIPEEERPVRFKVGPSDTGLLTEDSDDDAAARKKKKKKGNSKINDELTERERLAKEQIELNSMFGKAKPMPFDMMNEIAANFDINVKTNDNIELRDLIASFSRYYKSQKILIMNAYQDDPITRTALLENLRDIFYQKFEMHCMDDHSDVSKPQQKCNAYFKTEKLGEKCFNLPISDPQKSVIELFLIWHSNALHHLEGVAMSNKNITLGYIMAGDRWRREFGELGLHLNLVLTGRNATSKTMTLQKILMLILKDSCTEVNESSLKADTIMNTSTDDIFYSDDGSFASNFKNAGDDSTAKSHRTTQIITRAVLEFLKDGKGTKREKTIYKNLMICLYFMCTNETIHDLESLPGAVAESVKAFYYRYVAVEALEYESVINNVPRMQAMMEACEEEDTPARKEFRDFNIKYHTICGWVHKLMDIDNDLFDVDMRPFGDIWERLTVHLTAEHKRVRQQIYLFARQMCILDAYLNEHCVPTGMYYNKPFSIYQLKSWKPVLFEHHVFISLSFFRASFMSPISEPVIDGMAGLMNDSINNTDGRVIFDEIEKAKASIAKMEKEQKEKEAEKEKEKEKEKKAAANDANKKQTTLNNLVKSLKPVEKSFEKNAHLLNTGMRMPTRETKQTDYDVEEDDDEIEAEDKAANYDDTTNNDVPHVHKDLGEEVDATYVHFKMSQDEFASYLVMLNKEQGAKVQPSKAQILALLNKLRNTLIRSKKLVLSSIHDTFPKEDTASKSVFMPAIKQNHHNGVTTFSVHFGLLKQNSEYRDPVKKAILNFCHSQTLERNLLLAIDDTEFPWLYQSVKLKPNYNQVMEIVNNSYVFDHTIARLFGTTDRSAVLSNHRNHIFTRIDQCDIDTFSILRRYQKDINEGIVSPIEVIKKHHPKSITDELTVYMKEAIRNGEKIDVNGKQAYVAVMPYPHYEKYELNVLEKVYQKYKKDIERREEHPEVADGEDNDADDVVDKYGNPLIPKKYANGDDMDDDEDADNKQPELDDDGNVTDKKKEMVVASYFGDKEGGIQRTKQSMELFYPSKSQCLTAEEKKQRKKTMKNINDVMVYLSGIEHVPTKKMTHDNIDQFSDNEQESVFKDMSDEQRRTFLSKRNAQVFEKTVPVKKSNVEIEELTKKLVKSIKSHDKRDAASYKRDQEEAEDEDAGDGDAEENDVEDDAEQEEEERDDDDMPDAEDVEMDDQEAMEEEYDKYQNINKEKDRMKRVDPTIEEQINNMKKRSRMTYMQQKIQKQQGSVDDDDDDDNSIEESNNKQKKKTTMNTERIARLRMQSENLGDFY